MLAIPLVLAACGGGDGGSSSTSTTSPGATASSGSARATKGDAVDIRDFEFGPSTLKVQAGTKVTFTNEDSAAHTATANDSSFDTGTLDKGDSKTISFGNPGTFTYYCRFHAFMKASIVVD